MRAEEKDKDQVIAQISAAFAGVKYPGDYALRGSDVGNEPYLLEEEFRGKNDWRVLEAKFIDQAPDGFGSALSFFSDRAFHFYLPAYLLADIRGLLGRSDPVFHLTHGLERSSRKKRVNPRLYGNQTWFEEASVRFAGFNDDQAASIVAYLTLIKRLRKFKPERRSIDEALNYYWRKRAKGEVFNVKPRPEPLHPLVMTMVCPSKPKRRK